MPRCDPMAGWSKPPPATPFRTRTLTWWCGKYCAWSPASLVHEPEAQPRAGAHAVRLLRAARAALTAGANGTAGRRSYSRPSQTGRSVVQRDLIAGHVVLRNSIRAVRIQRVNAIAGVLKVSLGETDGAEAGWLQPRVLTRRVWR